MNTDECFAGTLAGVVDGMGNKFLTCAGCSLYENRCLTFCYLRNLIIYTLHLTRFTHDIPRLVTASQLGLQFTVFLHEMVLLLLHIATQQNRPGQHGCNRCKNGHILIQLFFIHMWTKNTQSANDILLLLNRHTDKRGICAFPLFRAIQEYGRFTGAGNNHRLTGENHLTGDSLANLILTKPVL